MTDILSDVKTYLSDHLVRAYTIAQSSPDPSTQNGAILLDAGGFEIGRGCNDFPSGIDSRFWHGEKADKYARVVHAEMAALLEAARLGYSTVASTLVCPWAACSNCAKHIAAAGVSYLVRHAYSNSGVTTGSHWYADCLIGDEIMEAAGVKIIEMEPVQCGIQLRRDGSLWP